MRTQDTNPISACHAARLAAALGLLCAAVAHAFDLTVTIQNARSNEGTVRAALYEAKTGWLRDGAPVQRRFTTPQSSGTVIVFHDLPAGRYAVSGFHDENGNEKLDTNAMGMNIEPIAFSRDARGRMGPPKFDDAAFDLTQDMAITMALH
ncbi:MAG: DUF2141 domain-containing protein [Burkholderiales bacterium]|nr:DUF2141 domain-containing protein [Burkholderiales bacterium]